jgi:hypothetical protein
MSFELSFLCSLFLGCVFTIFLSSCNYAEKKDAGGSTVNVATSNLDFAAVKSAVFAPRCLACHQQYDTFAGVKNEIASIAAAVSSDRMPKSGGPLDDNLKKILREWIELGAPEIKGAVAAPPTVIALEPNWNSIALNIVNKKCLVCHSPQGQAKFLDLSTRQAFFSGRNRTFGPSGAEKKLLDFETPEKSYLIDVVEDPVEPMPPTWSNIERLTSQELKVLQDWIGLGLP